MCLEDEFFLLFIRIDYKKEDISVIIYPLTINTIIILLLLYGA